jgi:transcriptional regulator NrdR family protein
MRCPTCGSEDSERYRAPVQRADVVLRRHRCRGCRTVFLSAQTVVTEELAEHLLPLLEETR